MTAPAFPRATLLIPACNEAAVIGRTLTSVTGDMDPGEFRIIVIANACKDDTAAAARMACPQAEVIETATPGKANALNTGYGLAGPGITICLDADLTVTARDLRLLVAPLETGAAKASCGRMDVDLTGCSASVRAFYGIWLLNPYFSAGKFGGLFALSKTGAERVLPLPEVTADDEYVSRSFPAGEKAFAPDCRFTVHAPRDLESLIRIRRRSLRGARALTGMGLQAQGRTGGGTLKALLSRAIPRPSLWPGMAVYLWVAVRVRLALARERPQPVTTWERDDSSRSPIPAITGRAAY